MAYHHRQRRKNRNTAKDEFTKNQHTAEFLSAMEQQREDLQDKMPAGWKMRFLILSAIFSISIEYGLAYLDHDSARMDAWALEIRRLYRWVIRRYGPIGGEFLIRMAHSPLTDPDKSHLIEDSRTAFPDHKDIEKTARIAAAGLLTMPKDALNRAKGVSDGKQPT